eukprot:1159553-Pelagomonas_calceolata.AAC.20
MQVVMGFARRAREQARLASPSGSCSCASDVQWQRKALAFCLDLALNLREVHPSVGYRLERGSKDEGLEQGTELLAAEGRTHPVHCADAFLYFVFAGCLHECPVLFQAFIMLPTSVHGPKKKALTPQIKVTQVRPATSISCWSKSDDSFFSFLAGAEPFFWLEKGCKMKARSPWHDAFRPIRFYRAGSFQVDPTRQGAPAFISSHQPPTSLA